MVAAIPMSMVAYHLDGEFGVTRLFRGLLAGVGVYMAFAKEIPFYFGSQLVGRLSGWAKAWGVIPVIASGALMIIYAQEITCFSTRYKYLCA